MFFFIVLAQGPGSEPHCMATQSGGTCVLRLHYIIGPTGSIMNMMMCLFGGVNAAI